MRPIPVLPLLARIPLDRSHQTDLKQRDGGAAGRWCSDWHAVATTRGEGLPRGTDGTQPFRLNHLNGGAEADARGSAERTFRIGTWPTGRCGASSVTSP